MTNNPLSAPAGIYPVLVVAYNSVTAPVGVARPTNAAVVYWVGFPSTPTNAQSQDIVAGTASNKLISEYSGPTTLSSQTFPVVNGRTPTGVTIDIAIAPGCGGGAGRRGAVSTVRCGGGGGASGGIARGYYIPAALFGTSWGVTVPAGGTGGAAVTTNDTNGNNGNFPTPSYCLFQTGSILFTVAAGDIGYGGTAISGSGSSYQGAGITALGINGQAASTTGGPGVSGGITYGSPAPGPGASGGGITSGNVAGAGAAGSGNPYYVGANGGTAGVVDGTLPSSPAAVTGTPGNSAGSGAASITAAAQAGAPGLGYGVGGSGGGASLNGNNSGAGGSGGPGFIRLVWDFS